MRESLPLQEGFVGALWRFDHSHRSPIHCHDELEFNLCLAGRANYLVRDRRVRLCRGTLLWLFPEEDHVLLEASADFSMWIGVLREHTFQAIARNHSSQFFVRREIDRVQVAELRAGACSRLDALLETVFEMRSDPSAFNMGAPFALLAAWDAFTKSVNFEAGDQVHPAVRKAAVLLSKTPTLKSFELAQAVGLTYAHLSRLFRKQLNIMLVRYRQERMLERFLELARLRPHDTAHGLALEAGFGSYAQFYRVFFSLCGKPPAEFLASENRAKVVHDGGEPVMLLHGAFMTITNN